MKVMGNIRVEINGASAKLFIGDQELSSHVSEYTLTHKGGNIAQLQLTIPALELSLEGPGWVVVPENIRGVVRKMAKLIVENQDPKDTSGLEHK